MLFLCSWKRRKREAVRTDKDTCGKCGDLLPGHVGLDAETYGIHAFYTFDYVTEPDIDTSDGVETRIRFYISENQLQVAWTSYEPVDNEDWEYVEKKAYEISFTPNDSE